MPYSGNKVATCTVRELAKAEEARRHTLWPTSAVLPYFQVTVGMQPVMEWYALELPQIIPTTMWLKLQAITSWKTGETQSILIGMYTPLVVIMKQLKGPQVDWSTWNSLFGMTPFQIEGYRRDYYMLDSENHWYVPVTNPLEEGSETSAIVDLNTAPPAWLLERLAAERKD